MIKNIIFDIGRVLIQYEPTAYLHSLGYDKKTVKELDSAIFKNKFWLQFDLGNYTYEQGIEYLQNENPHLKDEIARVLDRNWLDILEEKKETSDFLRKLKNENYKIYFLSNFSAEGFEFLYNKFDFFKLCDGKVISGYVHKIKPDEEIYLHLLNEYDLIAGECIFIDDFDKNIDTANRLGFKTILFRNIEDCVKQFESITAK